MPARASPLQITQVEFASGRPSSPSVGANGSYCPPRPRLIRFSLYAGLGNLVGSKQQRQSLKHIMHFGGS
jgi:hypothetical protein